MRTDENKRNGVTSGDDKFTKKAGKVKKKQELMREIVIPSHARVYLKTRKTCAQCGKIFEGTKKAKYCSVDCNRKANYARHREEYLERQRIAYREHGRTDRAGQAEKKRRGRSD